MTGRSHDSDTFDVIVVLGAAVGAGGGPSAALRRRVAEGVRRLEAGAAPVLLLSGGKGSAKGGGRPSEAEVMRDLALAAGVAEERLVLETDSRSTLENARCSARIMRARGWTKALVVTDAVHLPRALLAFRALGIDAKGAAVMGGARDQPLWTWPVHLAREALAFLWYGALIAARRHRR
ncbi:MAG: YdcF family protein [Proteobacteria bacterium]|nr:YdcF family protein [Pseudomonadota bacterium]